MVSIFDAGDQDYLDWVDSHRHGFVLNTGRNFPPNYMVIHKAGCSSITDYTEMAKEGGFTERDYVKICAQNKSELREWVRQHGRPDGSFTGHCPICQP